MLPFLNQINFSLLVVFGVGLLGHVTAQILDRRFSLRVRPRQTSSRLAVWLLAVVPILSFIAIWGFTSDAVRQFIVLLFTLAWLFAAYFSGYSDISLQTNECGRIDCYCGYRDYLSYPKCGFWSID